MKITKKLQTVRPEFFLALLLGICAGAFITGCSISSPSSSNKSENVVPGTETNSQSISSRTSDRRTASRSTWIGGSWLNRLFGGSSKIYSASGSLVLSFQLPPRESLTASAVDELHGTDAETAEFLHSQLKQRRFAPLLGYFPARLSKLPANNEIWLEFDQAEHQLKIFEGNKLLQTVMAESDGKVQCGEYLVQSKQNNPRWYASDQYFSSRGLSVPSEVSPERYLQGALGSQALFLSENLAIHSSPLWTSEVGGVRVDRRTLSKVFENAPLGVSVIVR